LPLRLSPAFSLRVTNSLSRGCTHLPLSLLRFGRGAGSRAANGEHLPDLGDLGVYPAFLGFKTFDSGGEYFRVELLGWHMKLSMAQSGRATIPAESLLIIP
jgi:hypothetical protein